VPAFVFDQEAGELGEHSEEELARLAGIAHLAVSKVLCIEGQILDRQRLLDGSLTFNVFDRCFDHCWVFLRRQLDLENAVVVVHEGL